MNFAEEMEKCDIIDLTQTLAEEEVDLVDEKKAVRYNWPFGHLLWRSKERGDLFTSYALFMGEHQGTHTDAPVCHKEGGLCVDEISLSTYLGSCCVMDFSGKPDNSSIEPDDIKEWERAHGEIGREEIVLLYYNRIEEFPGLTERAAEYLVDKGVKLVGTDAKAIEPYKLTHPSKNVNVTVREPAHITLLSNNVVIVENLINLEKLPLRGAFFITLPLKIKWGSGSPVRAIALVPK